MTHHDRELAQRDGIHPDVYERRAPARGVEVDNPASEAWRNGNWCGVERERERIAEYLEKQSGPPAGMEGDQGHPAIRKALLWAARQIRDGAHHKESS